MRVMAKLGLRYMEIRRLTDDQGASRPVRVCRLERERFAGSY